MDTVSENIPSYEKFGFALLDNAFGEGLPNQWENDFARIFWQCLEINNGGFEQWIGNTGKKVGSSRVDLQACKLEYSIVSPK